eukprot:4813766-Prymnesium_polylepis.1
MLQNFVTCEAPVRCERTNARGASLGSCAPLSHEHTEAGAEQPRVLRVFATRHTPQLHAAVGLRDTQVATPSPPRFAPAPNSLPPRLPPPDAREVEGGWAEVAPAQCTVGAKLPPPLGLLASRGVRASSAGEAALLVCVVAPRDLPPLLLGAEVAALALGVGHVLAHLVVVLVEHLHLADACHVHRRHPRLALPLALLQRAPLLINVAERQRAAAVAAVA